MSAMLSLMRTLEGPGMVRMRKPIKSHIPRSRFRTSSLFLLVLTIALHPLFSLPLFSKRHNRCNRMYIINSRFPHLASYYKRQISRKSSRTPKPSSINLRISHLNKSSLRSPILCHKTVIRPGMLPNSKLLILSTPISAEKVWSWRRSLCQILILRLHF